MCLRPQVGLFVKVEGFLLDLGITLGLSSTIILCNNHLDPCRKTLRWAPAMFLSKTPPFCLMAGVHVCVTPARVLGLFLKVLGLALLRGPCLCRKPTFLFNNSGQ